MNQGPEKIAPDRIDRQLIACGWLIQDKDKVSLSAFVGVVISEYSRQFIV